MAQAWHGAANGRRWQCVRRMRDIGQLHIKRACEARPHALKGERKDNRSPGNRARRNYVSFPVRTRRAGRFFSAGCERHQAARRSVEHDGDLHYKPTSVRLRRGVRVSRGSPSPADAYRTTTHSWQPDLSTSA
ncbi:hypothetical protein MRX96_007107 [Rhipicephalus microplus]